jgi:hypothetical protein
MSTHHPIAKNQRPVYLKDVSYYFATAMDASNNKSLKPIRNLDVSQKRKPQIIRWRML